MPCTSTRVSKSRLQGKPLTLFEANDEDEAAADDV